MGTKIIKNKNGVELESFDDLTPVDEKNVIDAFYDSEPLDPACNGESMMLSWVVREYIGEINESPKLRALTNLKRCKKYFIGMEMDRVKELFNLSVRGYRINW